MPLRDHFRPPVSKMGSWEAVHGQWPAMLVLALNRQLPSRFVAHPRVHLGSFAEIDVSTYEKHDAGDSYSENGNGGVATAVEIVARPTLDVATSLPDQDEYEVRIYDHERNQRLVAAIELVSPANKDRPEHRRAFVAKCVALLQNQVSVTIVDLVTVRNDNLYGEMLEVIGRTDPAFGTAPPGIYAVACRAIKTEFKSGAKWRLQTWFHVMEIAKPLPTLPLWLGDELAVQLELEATYEETCKALRIA